MCDNEERIEKIKRSIEEEHFTKMRNTSWHMPRETMQELQDELFQQNVEDGSDAIIDFLSICFW